MKNNNKKKKKTQPVGRDKYPLLVGKMTTTFAIYLLAKEVKISIENPLGIVIIFSL